MTEHLGYCPVCQKTSTIIETQNADGSSTFTCQRHAQFSHVVTPPNSSAVTGCPGATTT